MKPLLAALAFLLTASAGLAQSCIPYYRVEFCVEGTYWDGPLQKKSAEMTLWGDGSTQLEVGHLSSFVYEDYIGPNFEALNAIMDRIFGKNAKDTDRFKPLGDDTPALTDTSLYTADGKTLIHTFYAIDNMLLYVITSEQSDTVTESHIQRHIEALRSIQTQNLPVYIYPPEDCDYVGGPIYMCDPAHDWGELDLPEDLTGVGLTFENGITAQVDAMESVWVGIQVRAQKYSSYGIEGLIEETLTKIDGYPAITYVYPEMRDGQSMVVARTDLLLYQLSISAETAQAATTYTSDHRAQHSDVLAGILYYWD